MTNSNGFLNFNTPEDYLAYQDRLIYNWQRYHQNMGRPGKIEESPIYRQTGKTFSALKCVVDLALRPETKLVLFISHKHRSVSNFRHYSFFEKYSNGYASSRSHVGKIRFVSYDRLGHHLLEVNPESDYVIYDHQVFETCVPGSIARNRVKTPAEEAYKKLHGMYPNPHGASFCAEGGEYTDWEIFEQAFNLGLEA